MSIKAFLLSFENNIEPKLNFQNNVLINELYFIIDKRSISTELELFLKLKIKNTKSLSKFCKLIVYFEFS